MFVDAQHRRTTVLDNVTLSSPQSSGESKADPSVDAATVLDFGRAFESFFLQEVTFDVTDGGAVVVTMDPTRIHAMGPDAASAAAVGSRRFLPEGGDFRFECRGFFPYVTATRTWWYRFTVSCFPGIMNSSTGVVMPELTLSGCNCMALTPRVALVGSCSPSARRTGTPSLSSRALQSTEPVAPSDIVLDEGADVTVLLSVPSYHLRHRRVVVNPKGGHTPDALNVFTTQQWLQSVVDRCHPAHLSTLHSDFNPDHAFYTDKALRRHTGRQYRRKLTSLGIAMGIAYRLRLLFPLPVKPVVFSALFTTKRLQPNDVLGPAIPAVSAGDLESTVEAALQPLLASFPRMVPALRSAIAAVRTADVEAGDGTPVLNSLPLLTVRDVIPIARRRPLESHMQCRRQALLSEYIREVSSRQLLFAARLLDSVRAGFRLVVPELQFEHAGRTPTSLGDAILGVPPTLDLLRACVRFRWVDGAAFGDSESSQAMCTDTYGVGTSGESDGAIDVDSGFESSRQEMLQQWFWQALLPCSKPGAATVASGGSSSSPSEASSSEHNCTSALP